MSLLCLLASKPGYVFSKEEIFAQVWGQAFVEDSTLTRSISDLRRALGDDARSPHSIQTLPKKGYRCIAPVVAASNGEDMARVEPVGKDPVGEDPIQEPPRRRARLSRRWAAVIALALGSVALAGGWLALGSDPTAVPKESALSAYDYYLDGRDHYKRYRKGDNLEAIELYRKALEIDPSFALAHAELANALAVQKGNFHLPGPWAEQALAAARTAVNLQPTLPEAHKALGHALSLQDELSRAAAHYRKALELRPNYHEATHNLSLILHILGRHDEAFEGFQRFHAAGKMTADSAQHVGWIYLHVGLDAEAEEWFRRSLQLEPYHIGSQRGLAILERRQGSFVASRRRLEALLEVHPDCAVCVAEAGDLELFSGEIQAAAKLYRQALKTSEEGFPFAALRLGEALRLAGNDQADRWLREARNAARQGLEDGIENPWPAWIAAAVEAQDGSPREALSLLRAAVAAGWSQWDLDDPVFASLRPDASYQALLRENRSALLAMGRRITDLDRTKTASLHP